ncbi:MAG: hypothetical protein LBO07_04610 [Coriobacteriales bacterium]|jgi:predicted AAA+ superfamily ATPase|nr:hypothetical protein [Coriobacteriales bacterium]
MLFIAAFGISGTDAVSYLRDVFYSVVIKDVVKRNNIRDVDVLERIISYVIANIGQTFPRTASPNTL